MHAAKAWVMASWATVRPCGSGRVYPNFPDPDLDDWGHACYGANYARLVKIKAKYDPHGVFRFPQSLPAQQCPAGTTGTAGLHADAILAGEDRGTASEGKK